MRECDAARLLELLERIAVALETQSGLLDDLVRKGTTLENRSPFHYGT